MTIRILYLNKKIFSFLMLFFQCLWPSSACMVDADHAGAGGASPAWSVATMQVPNTKDTVFFFYKKKT